MGLSGIALSTILFGFSTSLAMCLFARILGGLLSGNGAIMDSIIGEITDETNQAKAFPMKALGWCIGAILGPILG
jgi:MFS family permease